MKTTSLGATAIDEPGVAEQELKGSEASFLVIARGNVACGHWEVSMEGSKLGLEGKAGRNRKQKE